MPFNMQNRIQILSTRPLHETLLQEAYQVGIDIDELSFIETTPIQSLTLQIEVDEAFQQSITAIFTSMNAVEAVAEQIKEKKPSWKIYCIGTTTQQLVVNYFGQDAIAGTANDAAALAKLIIEDQPKGKLIFFCGDQRRDELPEILQQNSILLKEIIVYQTTALKNLIKKQYEGILFFSPSGVESFFSNNQLTKKTILFAIGNTTAKEIKKHSNNQIVVSDEPGKENLARKMMEYFN
jgi:uroporphyrinogen-III synthase